MINENEIAGALANWFYDHGNGKEVNHENLHDVRLNGTWDLIELAAFLREIFQHDMLINLYEPLDKVTKSYLFK